MLAARKQSKLDIFTKPMHYQVSPDKITLSQGELTEDLSWDNIYKIKFSGRNLLVYINTSRANILTLETMGTNALNFVDIAKEKLKPFQVKVNKQKLEKVVK